MTLIELIKYILYHTPDEELTEQEIRMIKQNGLVHSCNSKNVDSILHYGVKGNLKPPMKRKEKGYTWFYIYDIITLEEKLHIIHGKGERKYNDAYVIVKGLSEQQIRKLRIRRKLDNAVIYPETLHTSDMIAKYIK